MTQESPQPEATEAGRTQRWIRRIKQRRAGESSVRLTTGWRRRATKARTWTTRTRPATEAEHPVDYMSLVVYLDTDDEAVITDVLSRVDVLRALAGYGAERNVHVQRGSIFRRSWAAIRRGLSAADVRDRLTRLEQAAELVALGRHQAAFDQAEANAVSALITSTKDAPRVCVRVGSILFLKYPTPGGEPAIVVRTLTQSEIRAFERFPEIQRKPEEVLQALATVMDTMLEISTDTTPPQSGLSAAQ